MNVWLGEKWCQVDMFDTTFVEWLSDGIQYYLVITHKYETYTIYKKLTCIIAYFLGEY